MTTAAEEKTKNEIAITITLDKPGVDQLISLFDTVRRTGSRVEATLALNWIAQIELSLKEEQDKLSKKDKDLKPAKMVEK